MNNTHALLKYQLLGPSGLRVSQLCLGAMTFGEEWGWGAAAAEVERMIRVFAEAGGNFIDMADFYTGGTSERLVGDAVHADRDRWILATKYSLHRDPDDPNAHGNHRKNLTRALDASLRRLRTDYIDVLWVHAWDFTIAEDDLMWALESVVQSGKVLHIGISDTPAWIVAAAQTTARLRGWQPFTAIQVEYSLKERSAESDLLPMADRHGLAVTAWSPLGSGVLTGKYADAVPEGSRGAAGYPVDAGARAAAIASQVKTVAARTGHTPAQIALAWVLSRRAPAIIPIVGARTVQQLEENLGSAAITLESADLDALDALTRTPQGFPHEFLRSDLARFALYGKTRARML